MSNFKLISARYENFKRHEDVTLNFSDTLTVLVGENYKGKSSLLQGIFFALFGLRAVPGGAEVVTRRGSKKKAQVTLTFEDGTDEYTVVRTPTTATLTATNGGLIASGGTAVNDWVSGRFSDLKKASLLSYSEQGDAQALLALGANKINALIEELSGADHVERLAKAAGERAARAQSQLDAIGDNVQDPAVVGELLAAATLTQDRAQAELATLDTQRAEATTQSTQAREALALARAANEAAEATNKRRSTWKTRLEGHEAQIATLEPRLAAAENPDTQKLKLELAPLVDQLASMKQKIGTKTRLETQLETSGRQLDKDKLKYPKHKESADRIQNIDIELNMLQPRIDSLSEEFIQAKRAVTNQKSALDKGTCSECHRPFENFDETKERAKLPNLETARDNISGALNKLNVEKEALLRERSGLTDELQPKGWAEELAERVKAVEAVEKLLKEYGAEINAAAAEALNEKVVDLTAQIRDADSKRRRYTEIKSDLDDAKENAQVMKDKLEETPEATVVDVADLVLAESAKQKALNTVNESRSALAVTVAGHVAEVVRLKAAVEEARNLWQKRIDAETVKTRYAMFCKWLRDNKAAFLAETWAGILALVSEFTSATTAGAVSEVGRDSDGDFWFTEHGEIMPISAASGGQRSIIGTALRCALPSLLPAGLGFVVLDEPSADLDTEHAAALGAALRATERQVILVTHRVGEQYMSDAVIQID